MIGRSVLRLLVVFECCTILTSEYLYVRRSRTWEAAQDCCKELGLALVKINDQNTFDDVMGYLSEVKDHERSVWIGLKFDTTDKVLKWTDGSHSSSWTNAALSASGTANRPTYVMLEFNETDLMYTLSYTENKNMRYLCEGTIRNVNVAENTTCPVPLISIPVNDGYGDQPHLRSTFSIGTYPDPFETKPGRLNLKEDCLAECLRTPTCTRVSFVTGGGIGLCRLVK